MERKESQTNERLDGVGGWVDGVTRKRRRCRFGRTQLNTLAGLRS